MTEWVTVYREQNFTNAHLIKSFLEFEDIKVQLLDELTTQTGSIYFAASGGVRIQVKESDVAQAMTILKEKGYGNPDVDKSNRVFDTLGKYSKKIPFLKDMRIEAAVITLAAILFSIIFAIFFALTRDSNETIIMKYSWRLVNAEHNGKVVIDSPTRRFDESRKTTFDKSNTLYIGGNLIGDWDVNWTGSEISIKTQPGQKDVKSTIYQTFDLDMKENFMVLSSSTTRFTFAKDGLKSRYYP
ncbi:MAG: hypothetical protein ACJASQ_001034 [Crocinitomicaceae bacterium]|jgi:hypothetical protein